MRIKHNNINFVPVLLDDAYRRVASMLQRHYDPNISAKDVASYIDSAARSVYQELTGKQYQSWNEVYADFYSNFAGGTSDVPMSNMGSPGAASTYANFVASLNMGFTTEQATQAPKSVYRQLAIKLHPDSTQLDPEYAQKTFAELATLYNALPQELKNALSWYRRVKLASIYL